MTRTTCDKAELSSSILSRRSFIVAGGIAVAGLIAGRIGWVNAHAETVEEAHYSMGEWVDLDGCYFNELASEDMAGYSVRVVSAESMTAERYLDRYGKAEVGSSVRSGQDGDDVVVLDFEVRNSSNDGGGIALYQECLIPARKNVDYRYDEELWLASEPALGEGSRGGFGVARGTTYLAHVPFICKGYPDYLRKYDQEVRMPIGADTRFELILCNAPVRKMIDVSL